MKQTPFLTTALLTASTLFATLSVSAEQAASDATSPKPPRQEEVLSNASIVELKELALGDDLIVEKIKVSPCDFDVSVAGLRQLKAAQISEPVIKAMLSTKSARTANIVAVPGQPADTSNPQAPHEAGIWLYREHDAKAAMTKLEPSVYSQTKSGPNFFIQFGEVAKTAAVIRSAHAEIQTTNHHPTFYFYFEKTQSGLSDQGNTATSPNEYILAEFDVPEKEKQRKLVMAQSGAYSGSEYGPDIKAVREFTTEKLAPGAYKVTVKEDLTSGEFGFFYAGNRMGGKVFDFGVQGSPEAQSKLQSENKPEPAPKTNWFTTIFGKGKS